ncbi:MAG: hypothetical protein AAF412_00555, partial [Pseudomonadota bacterium]
MTANDSRNKLAKRPPETVMRLKRIGSLHQSRLSFMRVLLRRLKRENWLFERPMFALDGDGVGTVTYRATGPERSYTLVAFAHKLPDEKRSDRVIADAWDATFTLFDGIPSDDDIERLSQNVPLQEAGRISGREFVLSRANKSVRLFEYVCNCLAAGKQPEAKEIDKVGYLMRTTAVYGSAKFGAADRSVWAERAEFSGSFQPELLSVWFIRQFAADWVEHLARLKGGKNAVALSSALKRRLGIGNSTGLGMAPFLINHPALIHSWIDAREEALARVCAIEEPSKQSITQFTDLLSRAQLNVENWHSSHPLQVKKIRDLKSDLRHVSEKLSEGVLNTQFGWRVLSNWCEKHLSHEGQEQINSLVLEPHAELVDDLAQGMYADETQHFRINGRAKLRELKQAAQSIYKWASNIDFEHAARTARVWYTSEEKLEPRLGKRHEEPLESYEQPLAPARDALRMLKALDRWDEDETVAYFLLNQPEHRHIVRRIQILQDSP